MNRQQLNDVTALKIRQNGTGMITGDVLNDVLSSIIESVKVTGEPDTGVVDWKPSITYNIGDVVLYGGQIWICQTVPTIGEFHSVQWQMIGKSVQTVQTLAERDQIEVRFIGMKCVVSDTGETYELRNDISNSSWFLVDPRSIQTMNVTISSDGQTSFSVVGCGEIMWVQINGIQYPFDSNFNRTGNVITWIGDFDLETDDDFLIIHKN